MAAGTAFQMTLGAAEADMSTATVVPHARCSAGQAALVRADDGRVEPRANSAPSFAGGTAVTSL